MRAQSFGRLGRAWPATAFVLGAVCAVLMGAQVFELRLGDTGTHLLILCVLLALLALSILLIKWEGYSAAALLLMVLPVALALLVRTLCLDHISEDYTMFLADWAAFFRDNGGFSAIAMDVGDYNVSYLYFIAAISYLDVPDLYLYKLFSILFDVLLAWGGLRLVRVLRGDQQGDTMPLVAFGALLFLPTVVLNGAYWGQCDAIYGALVVHGVAQALDNRPKSSLVLVALAFSFKLQTVFVLPLWGALWLAGRIRFRELWLFPLTYVGTILPALGLGKPLWDILRVYFDQMGQYPRLTLNAPSVFQFIPYGMEVNDGLLSRLGIGAAALLVAVLLMIALGKRQTLNREAYMAMAVVLAIGVPFFLPHMHERYFFLADVLTLCWASTKGSRFGVFVLAAGSSLASYMVYLRLEYNWVVSLFGLRFVMGAETLAMLVALIWAILLLVLELNNCKVNLINRRTEL